MRSYLFFSYLLIISGEDSIVMIPFILFYVIRLTYRIVFYPIRLLIRIACYLKNRTFKDLQVSRSVGVVFLVSGFILQIIATYDVSITIPNLLDISNNLPSILFNKIRALEPISPPDQSFFSAVKCLSVFVFLIRLWKAC